MIISIPCRAAAGYGAAAASLNPPSLLRRSCRQETSGRYGTAAAVRLLVAQRCPASCRCSGDSASRGSDGDGVAYNVAYLLLAR